MLDKSAILDAIRRCSEDNGGVPGRNRFAAQTGITETQWLGIYWARWSDAVREAGLEPNTFNKAHNEREVIAKFAGLVRELGHFPTDPEVRLKRRSDPTFPSTNVFRRFGNRAGVARKLVDLLGDDAEHRDAVVLCEEVIQSLPTPKGQGEAKALVEYVYLMKSGRHYKIGRSNSAGRRAYEIALQMPERVAIVHVIETDDSVGLERYWHERFADRRTNGEWFALTAADVEAFRRRKKFM